MNVWVLHCCGWVGDRTTKVTGGEERSLTSGPTAPSPPVHRFDMWHSLEEIDAFVKFSEPRSEFRTMIPFVFFVVPRFVVLEQESFGTETTHHRQ